MPLRLNTHFLQYNGPRWLTDIMYAMPVVQRVMNDYRQPILLKRGPAKWKPRRRGK